MARAEPASDDARRRSACGGSNVALEEVTAERSKLWAELHGAPRSSTRSSTTGHDSCSIEQSDSWRVTAPLRKAKSAVERFGDPARLAWTSPAARARETGSGHRRHSRPQRGCATWRRCSPPSVTARGSARSRSSWSTPGRPTARSRSQGDSTRAPRDSQSEFSHGGTRNLIMRARSRRPRGFPDSGRDAGARWLARRAARRIRAGAGCRGGLRASPGARPTRQHMIAARARTSTSRPGAADGDRRAAA